ncbi:hypothetical protein [Bradyrhizobium canariense]|uniref:hypothetical protein n=1 Tax=Bradyrhizobium canariense TaxID=255045 RepID=UPI001B8A192E|nr:hypothetical protein [Bradyrhizobium canariense]MBR0953883.1 hypothetical protein [Bradyrhizobium canariense]
MNRTKQTLALVGSALSMTAIAGATYFLFWHKSLTATLAFVAIVPVFLIIALGLLKLARRR